MTAKSRLWFAGSALLMALVALAALAIRVPTTLAQDSPGEVEVVGAIEAIQAGTTITVNGLRIETAGAEIKTTLVIGAAVKVEGTLQPDGTIWAREVKTAEDDGLLPGEIEVAGTLQALTSTTATVNGIIFDIAAAEVQSGLAVGELVKVHARLGDGGVWVAREIERFVATPDADAPDPETPPVPAGFDDDELEIVGTLDEVGENYVVVAGQRYDTTGAEVKGVLVVGTLVKLELKRLDSGILIVEEVKPTTFSDDSDDSLDDSSDDGDSDDSGDDSSKDGDADDSVDDSVVTGPACAFEIKVASANLRSGPGTGYDVIGYVFHDQKFSVVEIDATGTWIKVAMPTGQQGWLALSVGELDDDCSGLPVADDMFKDDDHSGDDDSDDSAFDDSHDDSDDDHSGDSLDDSSDDSPDDSPDDSSDDDSDDDHGDDHEDDDHGDDDDDE